MKAGIEGGRKWGRRWTVKTAGRVKSFPVEGEREKDRWAKRQTFKEWKWFRGDTKPWKVRQCAFLVRPCSKDNVRHNGAAFKELTQGDKMTVISLWHERALWCKVFVLLLQSKTVRNKDLTIITYHHVVIQNHLQICLWKALHQGARSH